MGSQFDELCDDDNKNVQLNSKKIQSTRKIQSKIGKHKHGYAKIKHCKQNQMKCVKMLV